MGSKPGVTHRTLLHKQQIMVLTYGIIYNNKISNVCYISNNSFTHMHKMWLEKYNAVVTHDSTTQYNLHLTLTSNNVH